MARSNEPFWWALFSAGGVVAAVFLPVTILLTSIGVANQWVGVSEVRKIVWHPLGRLYLFVIISLPLFHFAHRFRFTLVDLGLKALSLPIAVLCYGSAIGGTVLAAVLLAKL